MGILNLVLQGNSIKHCVRRFTVDGACSIISDLWSLINDYYDGYVYNLTVDGCSNAVDYLDSLGYPHGVPEDITPEADMLAWLNAEDSKGRAGIESKSDIYVRLIVDFPGTTCIQAF
jgi:hypothetical protein